MHFCTALISVFENAFRKEDSIAVIDTHCVKLNFCPVNISRKYYITDIIHICCISDVI